MQEEKAPAKPAPVINAVDKSEGGADKHPGDTSGLAAKGFAVPRPEWALVPDSKLKEIELLPGEGWRCLGKTGRGGGGDGTARQLKTLEQKKN